MSIDYLATFRSGATTRADSANSADRSVERTIGTNGTNGTEVATQQGAHASRAEADARPVVESEKSANERPAVLHPASAPQTLQDWRDFYEERAALAEYEAGLSRQDAEKQALSCCVAAWLNANPDIVDNIDCPQCGVSLDFDAIIQPADPLVVPGQVRVGEIGSIAL